MHMSDALLSPAIGAAFWAGTLGAIAYSSKRIKDDPDEKSIPLMGVVGAFVFAAQMVNFTIPGTGSSGHLGGGLILAAVLGPYAAFIVMASVLTIQALFFADGGLLALGCNLWNLGVYACFVTYFLIYKPIVRRGMTRKRIMAASLVSGVVAFQLGAFSVVLETFLSGRSELPLTAFAAVMQPIHLAIGIVEGLVTAAVINFVNATRPELLTQIRGPGSLSVPGGVRKVAVAFLAIAIATGGISWFASQNPDGLEWSIKRLHGGSELPETKGGIPAFLRAVQKKTAILPDYTFSTKDGMGHGGIKRGAENVSPAVAGAESRSDFLGSAIMIFLISLAGFGARALRRKVSPS